MEGRAGKSMGRQRSKVRVAVDREADVPAGCCFSPVGGAGGDDCATWDPPGDHMTGPGPVITREGEEQRSANFLGGGPRWVRKI